MKVNCTYCHSKIEFDEKGYAPGETVTVECRRCGEEMNVTIPSQDDGLRPELEKNDDIVNRASEPSNVESNPITWTSTNFSAGKVSEDTPQSILNENKDVSMLRNADSKISQQPEKIRKTNDADVKVNENELNGMDLKENIPVPPPIVSKPNSPQPNTLKEKVDVVPPVISDPVTAQGNSGCGTWFIILLVGVLIGVGIWMFRSCKDNKQVAEEYAVNVVEEAPAEVEVIEEVEDIVEDTAVLDTLVAVAAEVVEVPAAETEVKRIYLPTVSKYTSSEAYDVYPAYVTEEKFGDSWATVDVVQDAVRNGMVECFVRGEGDIEGYPLSIDAVRLKDGRFYGRYHNDYNGVKLDINGGFDSNDDLIIKLGHKSETSYWVLKFVGTCEDGSLQYSGTWGRKDKPTSLKISLRDK